MTYDYKAGKKRYQRLIEYLVAQGNGTPKDNFLNFATTHAELSPETADEVLTYLLHVGLITLEPTLDNEVFINTANVNLGRPMPDNHDQQLTELCATTTNSIQLPTHRGGRGAQPGNNNALKHGRYADQFNRLLAAANHTDNLPGPYNLDRQRELLAAAIEDIAVMDPPDPELLIKAELAYLRVTIGAAALNHIAPKPPPPEADEWTVT